MAQLISLDSSITFTDGGYDENGDHIIYMDSNAVTEPYPIICSFQDGTDVLNNVYWDDARGTWVIEHGSLSGQLT